MEAIIILEYSDLGLWLFPNSRNNPETYIQLKFIIKTTKRAQEITCYPTFLLAMTPNERSPLSRSEFYFQFQKIHVFLKMAPKLSIKLKSKTIFCLQITHRVFNFIKKTLSTFNKIIIVQWEDHFSLMNSSEIPLKKLSARRFNPNCFPLN